MPKKDDGGPAFPGAFAGHCGKDNHADPCSCYLEEGMTLRDWFAGQAEPAMMGKHSTPEEVARQAYLIADAMIAERERK